MAGQKAAERARLAAASANSLATWGVHEPGGAVEGKWQPQGSYIS